MDKITKLFTRANAKHWPVNLEKILRFAWQNSDKDLKVTVEEDSLTRNGAQNRLLWRWHGEYVKHRYNCAGEVFSSEQWHDKMVPELIPSEPVKINGEWHIPRAETKKLTVKEFADFLTRYEIEAKEEGCVFSRPDDLYLKAVMKDEQ